MKTSCLTLALVLASTTLTGCSDSADSADPAAPAAEATTPNAASAAAAPAATAADDAPNDLRGAVRKRLFALDYYASQMWTLDNPDAPLDWLKQSAAEHGVELTGTMPEQLAVADSVATRRVRVRAQGDWDALLGWLSAIEDSPRRFIARDIALHRLRGRSVADLQLTALIDRPAALTAVGAMDLTSLDNAGLASVLERLDADLLQKGQTLDRLGADVSWARPIAAVTQQLTEGSQMIRLQLDREDLAGRAERFAGSFTAQVPDADDIDPLITTLNATAGFAEAKLTKTHDVGAGFRRADVGFTYGQPAEEAGGEGAPLADDTGAGLQRNPFRGAEAKRVARAPRATRVAQGRRHVTLDAPRVSGGRRGLATRTGPNRSARGPREISRGQFTSGSGFARSNAFRFESNTATTAGRGPRTATGTATTASQFRFENSSSAATSSGARGPRTTNSVTPQPFSFSGFQSSGTGR